MLIGESWCFVDIKTYQQGTLWRAKVFVLTLPDRLLNDSMLLVQENED